MHNFYSYNYLPSSISYPNSKECLVTWLADSEQIFYNFKSLFPTKIYTLYFTHNFEALL